MKKIILHLALVVFLAPLLTQCVAGQSEVRGMDLRLQTMDSRVDDMERHVQALKNQTGTQAELGMNLDQIKARLLQIEGQFEESTNQSRKLQDSGSSLRSDLDKKLLNIEQRLNDLDGRITAIGDQVSTALGTVQDMKTVEAREASERAEAAAAAAREARKKAESAEKGKETTPDKAKKKADAEAEQKAEKKQVEQKAEKPPTAEKTEKSEKQESSDPDTAQYDKAYSLFQKEKYKEAYNAFSEYLEKHPQGKMAANARYWLGECYYHRKEYELAILEYQKVIADFPKESKAAAALLKQGMSFESLKEKETARIVYNKLVEEYPKSEQAAEAKARLKEIAK